MKNFSTQLASYVIVSGIGLATIPAAADTAYHEVYKAPVIATDAFSMLDKYSNNVLTPEEYNNASLGVPFEQADANKDGFITRTEFYAARNANVDAANVSNEELLMIQPAAGGVIVVHDCVYSDDIWCETRPAQ
jgi:hypothetical protein